MSATVYLVRHGRTALNAQGRFRGREDPPLDARGFAEAASAARILTRSGIRVVFASPLLRSLQTAEAIAAAAGVATRTEGRLIDLDHGAWTALTADEAAEAAPEAFARFRREPRRAVAPGGESMHEVESRMVEALTDIAGSHDGASAAAVSHEIPIRLVLARLSDTSGADFWNVDLPTGSVTHLGYDDGVFSLTGGIRKGARR